MNPTPPIALRSRHRVFENSKFEVFSDHLVDREGTEVRDFLVVAPRALAGDLISGVTVAPILNGRVVLLRSYRHPVGRSALEAPRGFVEAGEDPRDAALRELREETGLVCPPEGLISLGYCAPEASLLAARVALFAATEARAGDGPPVHELGLGKAESFTIEETRELLRRGEIEDATTALLLHRFFMRSGD